MWLKLFFVLFLLFLILPVAYAKENISIEEIGTEPGILIEGADVMLFAIISNGGDTPADIVLEFWLDGSIKFDRKNVTLGLKTYQKKILSDNSTIASPNIKMIRAVVYVGDIEVASKSLQLTVQKSAKVPEMKNNDYVFWPLMVVGIIIVIASIYLSITKGGERDKITEVRSPKTSLEEAQKAEIVSLDPTSQKPASETQSSEIVEFSNYMRDELKQYEEKKEYDLLSNIAFLVDNLGNNNIEDAKQDFKSVIRETSNLISELKKAQRAVAPPSKNELAEKLEKLKVESGHRKQFIDVLIPDFLLKLAEEKIQSGDIKAADGLISGAKELLENEEVKQRLRKLREIGF